MNVISNGLDYSPQGGTLYVDVQSNNGFVEISVTDEGTGFSKEALCERFRDLNLRAFEIGYEKVK